jgi:acetoin utilization deacetylase AcuC-like enzyme
MQVVFAETQFRHDPQRFLVRGEWRPCPEKPERADVLRHAAAKAGHAVIAPRDFGNAPLEVVHSPAYLSFLEFAHERWLALADAAPEVIPNVHPDRRQASYPDSVVGQAGFHMADTACPIGSMTWPSALASANSALHAAELVLAGAPVAYALCRPPGHHAFADMAGGFCYLNNTAIAAAWARRRHERVAILDVDLHHGNGTQGIYYDRADVLTVSLHADPRVFYPFFWGHANETGVGPGLGFNLNLPLPLGTGDAAYMPVLDRALAEVRAYGPGLLVVALGLDAAGSDPFAGFTISTAGFAEIAKRIATLGLPTVLVQEGGYLSDELGRNLVAFLAGFENHAVG